MRVLIVGASGYVGRFLAWKLQDSHELICTDIVEPDDSRVPWVYDALSVARTDEFLPKPSASIPFVRGDIMDFDFCRKITENVDAVILLSASVNHDDVVACFTTNTVSTFNMLEAAAANGVKRLLAASSINACGLFHCRATDRPRKWAYLPVDEEIPTDHEDAYSLSKYCNELSMKAWTNRTQMTTAAFRFSGVFPPEWTQSYKDKVQPTTQWVDTLAEYVDLRDVVDGLQKALECDDLPASGVYQLTAPDTMYPEPTMEIIERFRPDLLKIVKKELPGRTSMLSWEKANKTFGYSPQHCWKEVL